MTGSPTPDGRPSLPRRVWAALPPGEGQFIARALREETVGGALLLAAAVVALLWANSAWYHGYESMLHTEVGPLDLEHWAADGGLAVFFFLAGLELKRELVVGSLSRPADALVPVAAAVAGMVLPAVLYLAIVAGHASADGWAIPMATDIAFALAVLAVVGRRLPASLRAFLLTLAVVDDLGAILVIATVFTDDIDPLPLAGAAAGMVAYAVLQRRRVSTPLVYVPLAIATWWLVYESGVHATIAGVALGLLTRVRPDADEDDSPAERLEHRIRPLSAGLAVPLFALMAAGVRVNSGSELWSDRIVVGIVVGLVVGKAIGVIGGAWIVTRLTRAELAPEIDWADVAAVSVLAGIGFTVSLLISDLAFAGQTADDAKAAVLIGSLIAGLLAAVLLRRRSVHHQTQLQE
ncbi:MAG TPA: Na+/H+ antiporter NhaA [Nocardioidaceae bacterium]|nr:Na+/H+ antiporter NhaA [Nocardioidaceae bacterium]